MFSNTCGINPFPCFPSSSCPPLFLNHEKDESFLHDQPAVPFVPGDAYDIYSIPKATVNFTVNDCHLNQVDGDDYGLPSLLGRKPVKKDRHSKICTAQGVRDRRVRLSIGIARKFFDLQDMLGFDRASKTLDWLLQNSEKAIQELDMKNQSFRGGDKSLSSPSECQRVSGSNDCEDPADRFHSSFKLLLLEVDEDKPLERTQTELAKELRAKARAKARARERTRGKMLHHSRSLTGNSTKLVSEIENSSDSQAVFAENILEEPVAITGKSIPSMISEDERYNISSSSSSFSLFPPDCTSNWNATSAATRLRLGAVTHANHSRGLYPMKIRTPSNFK